MSLKVTNYNILKGLEENVDYLLESQKIGILEEIAEVMQAKNISRADLARKLGTSRAYITKMLRANVNFTLKSLVQVAKVLETELSMHLHSPEAQTVWFDVELPKESKPHGFIVTAESITEGIDDETISPAA